METLTAPTIHNIPKVLIMDYLGWMKPIIMWLDSGILPLDKEETRKIRQKAALYSYEDIKMGCYSGDLAHTLGCIVS